jgi:excisionase family DNA binding protein
MEAAQRILTAKEVADYLRCHISTIYRLAKRHQLPAFRVGNDWRFATDAIETWLQNNQRIEPQPKLDSRL